MTTAGQGRGAGGIESIANPQIVSQFGRGRKRLRVKAHSRGIVALDETEFRYIQIVGRSGLLFSLHDGGQATFKSHEASAAMQLGFQVAAQTVL